MKTILSWMVVLLISVLFISCGEEKQPKQEATVDRTPTKKDDVRKEEPVAETPAPEVKEEPKPSIRSSTQPVTLHGELVDLIAFVSSGPQQAADAIRKSARAGNPIGFFETKSRTLYVVGLPRINAPANEALMPYVGMRVFLTGKTYSKDGVNVIIMSDIGKSIQ